MPRVFSRYASIIGLAPKLSLPDREKHPLVGTFSLVGRVGIVEFGEVVSVRLYCEKTRVFLGIEML